MFKSLGNRSAAEISADKANMDWMQERRNSRPQPAPTVACSSRLSDIPDPAIEQARDNAAREIANKEHKQLTRLAALAHRQKILGQPYQGPPALMELLSSCVRMTPSRQLGAQDYKLQCQMGRTQADEFLSPPLTEAEVVTCMMFMSVQSPPLFPDSTSWIVSCDILSEESVLRQAVFYQPVSVEPEPVATEKNPFPYSDYNGSDYAKWDRQKLVRDFDAEHTQVFRAGLTAAAEELGGISLSEADVLVLRNKCSNLPFHEWTAERIKNVALASFGGPTAVHHDPDEPLSSVQILNRYGVGTSVQRNG